MQTQLSKDTAELRSSATQRESAARAEAQGAIEQLQATAATLQVPVHCPHATLRHCMSCS